MQSARNYFQISCGRKTEKARMISFRNAHPNSDRGSRMKKWSPSNICTLQLAEVCSCHARQLSTETSSSWSPPYTVIGHESRSSV
jgi:hypothetical protein